MAGSRGYQIRVDDPALQAYLQRYPFASGPDAAKNAAGREAILQGLRVRPAGNEPRQVLLRADETALAAPESERLQALFARLGMEPSQRQTLVEDFGWEANLVPRTAKRALILGCGNGMELLFLRAVLPEASIVAVDYYDSVAEPVKEAVGLRFIEGDMNAHLQALRAEYDLVMSNHTMEHFYTPDETIGTLFGLLAPGGVLIATLPMDAKPGSPFLGRVRRTATKKRAKPLDLVFLDSGHPWKTTPADMEGTLRRAGFAEVTVYQRGEHLSRPVKGSEARYRRGRLVGLALHAAVFRLPRALGRVLPAGLQARFSKVLLAVERRVWFGSNNLKNRYTEEALVYATKGA